MHSEPMSQAYGGRTDSGVFVCDASRLPWQDTPEPGLRLKPVRYDNRHGQFLGLVGFDPMTRSGLHQHHGVATSFVIDGCLTDYCGAIGLHQAGINLVGATHDAFAYQRAVLVSRLDGPVAYPPERGALSGLHAGSHHAEFVNPAREVPPEINVDVDALPPWQTGIEGLTRQMVFDYTGSGRNHRHVQWRASPGLVCPPWRASALTEFWVRGGLFEVNGITVHANSFVIAEAGTELRLRSPFGALLLAWAEGPEAWLDASAAQGPRAVRTSLFGF